MYSIMDKNKDFTPAHYAVFVEVAHYPNCGFKPDQKLVGRCGAAKTIEDARRMIASDKKAMGDTMGGLIEAVSTKGRSYSIWKTEGWKKVEA